MIVINGKKIAEEIVEGLKKLPMPKKILAVFLIGEDESSLIFLKQKEKTAKELGVDFRVYKFPDSPEIDNDFLRKEVGKMTLKKNVGGMMVQLPLPERINSQYVLNAIPREKDIDVLGERALGAFYTERNPVLPPAVGVIQEIVNNFSDKRVAVAGLGSLIGKPIALWLIRKTKDLYLLHRGSDFGILKQADIVISGTGSPGLIKSEMLKEGAGVIDFGYSFADGKIRGDFEADRTKEKLSFYTPVPGGAGPVLVAKLFENFYKLNK